MEFIPRQFLFRICAMALAIGLASAVNGETAPVVVGLARCSDCVRKNMNAEAAFKGLQVAIKCKNSKGEYESKAVGQLDKSGAFSVPLPADLVGEDGELKQECFAQLHSATSKPCPGQEPSKIVVAPHGSKTTFVALAGNVHEPSAECTSAYLCHAPVVVPPKPKPKHDHHPHPHPPKHDQDHDHDHDHAHPPVAKPPKPTPIYHPPSARNAATDPQLFKKLLPFLKKLPFFPPAKQNGKP